MFGRLVTSALMAMFLAGPGLCCCSLKRASAIERSPATGCVGPQLASHSCCQSDTGKQSPEKPGQCPCRKHHKQLVVSVNHGSSSTIDLLSSDHWRPDFESAIADVDALSGTGDPHHLEQQALDAPHLTSQGLLRALTVMRC